MCGLFGYVGPKAANPLTIKLLWIYSKKRGTDSTGLYRNRFILKSHYDYMAKSTGDSFDYLYGAIMRPTLEHHTIIGHCRQKSVGQITKENTHPFEYEERGSRWIFAHNGTIKNIDALATKYGISRNYSETDSQTLGHILSMGNFDVLLEYQGTAAFSLYNETEDTLYLWRGFSLQEFKTAYEERPLAIYKGKNYIYWASEELNLVTSLNTKSNIEQLKPNTLYKFVGGKLVDTIEYDRSNVAIQEPVTVTKYNEEAYGYSRKYYNTGKRALIEPNPQNIAGAKIYFWNGKYYRSGHLVTGIYRLDESGSQIHDPNEGELYYFRYGYMLKDRETYEQYSTENDIKEIIKSPYRFSADLHPKSFLIHSNSIIKNGSYVFNGEVYPIFGYYRYVLNTSGNIEEYQKITTVNENEEATNPYEELWNNHF